jgi:hypothetical protein
MRQWQRATSSTLCGGCAALIAQGDPAQTITIAGVKRRLWRCRSCAGEPPPDLPMRLARTEPMPTTPMTRWKDVPLALDFKQKASGE